MWRSSSAVHSRSPSSAARSVELTRSVKRIVASTRSVAGRGDRAGDERLDPARRAGRRRARRGRRRRPGSPRRRRPRSARRTPAAAPPASGRRPGAGPASAPGRAAARRRRCSSATAAAGAAPASASPRCGCSGRRGCALTGSLVSDGAQTSITESGQVRSVTAAATSSATSGAETALPPARAGRSRSARRRARGWSRRGPRASAAASIPPSRNGPLGTDGVHHRQRVGGVRLERQVLLGRVGDPGVAAVEADHAGEAPEPLEEPNRLGQLPDGLDVGGGGAREDEVVLAARRGPGRRSRSSPSSSAYRVVRGSSSDRIRSAGLGHAHRARGRRRACRRRDRPGLLGARGEGPLEPVLVVAQLRVALADRAPGTRRPRRRPPP